MSISSEPTAPVTSRLRDPSRQSPPPPPTLVMWKWIADSLALHHQRSVFDIATGLLSTKHRPSSSTPPRLRQTSRAARRSNKTWPLRHCEKHKEARRTGNRVHIFNTILNTLSGSKDIKYRYLYMYE